MKLSHIRDILAVAEEGSLRAASRRLGITQPTMTRSIRDTENELGVMLFTRHGHGAVPTDLGRLFVRRGKAISAEIRHIYEELQQAKGNFSGQVSVAMSAAASIALLPVALDRFQRDCPRALLRLEESVFQPVQADIQSGEIDFYVGPLYEETSTTSLLVEKLFDNQRVIVMRKGHPLAGATSLAELQGARWIQPSFSDHRDEIDFRTMFERSRLPPPDIVIQTKSIMMTLMAVTSSDLLTVLPVQWLDWSTTSEPIATIKLEGDFHAAPVCVVRRGDMPLTPLAERLCDLIKKAALNYGLRLAGAD